MGQTQTSPVRPHVSDTLLHRLNHTALMSCTVGLRHRGLVCKTVFSLIRVVPAINTFTHAHPFRLVEWSLLISSVLSMQFCTVTTKISYWGKSFPFWLITLLKSSYSLGKNYLKDSYRWGEFCDRLVQSSILEAVLPVSWATAVFVIFMDWWSGTFLWHLMPYKISPAYG